MKKEGFTSNHTMFSPHLRSMLGQYQLSNQHLPLLTLLVRGKRQILQNIAFIHRLIRFSPQSRVGFSHPEQRMVVVLVVVGLPAQLKAVGRSQL